MNNTDNLVVNMIAEDIEKGLTENKTYTFALNVPRLKGLLSNYLQNKGYTFKVEDNTGFNGEYSRVQTRYIISL